MTPDRGRGNVEELVRRSLRERAGDVTPDPATWQKVQERLRRRQLRRWALAGAAAAVLAVVAVLAVPALLSSRVQFRPQELATQPPAPSPGPEQAIRAGAACSSDDPLVVVAATQAGDLVGSCRSGEQPLVVESADDVEADPALSSDGQLLAFTRRAGEQARERRQVVLLDFDTGVGRVLGDGYAPAFSPDDRLAWLVDEPGDGTQPQVVVGELGADGTVDVSLQFPVFMEGAEEFTARHLVWDASGQRLWWEAGHEGAGLWTADLTSEGPAPTPVAVTGGSEGASYVTPSPAPRPGTVTALQLCCRRTDGDVPDDAEIGGVTLTGEPVPGRETAVDARYAPLQGLNELPTPLDLDGPLYTAAAGALDIVPAGDRRADRLEAGEDLWLAGDAPAWLFGDGNATYLVDGYGDVQDVQASWPGFAVNPAFAPVALEGEQPTAEEPASEPAGGDHTLAANPCDRWLVAVLATAQGGLLASCSDGALEPLLEGEGRLANPALSPDGRFLAVERRASRRARPQVLLVDLDGGAWQAVAENAAWPAFSPSGKLAWIVDEPGDGRQPRIVVADAAGKPLGAEIAMGTDGSEELTARHLTWAADDRVIYVEAGYEGEGLFGADSVDGDIWRVAEPGGQAGSTFLAPAPGARPEEIATVQGCCDVTDGDVLDDLRFGVATVRQDEVTAFAEHTNLTQVQGLFEGPYHVSYAGAVDVQASERGGPIVWRPGDDNAWLVGNDDVVYLVDAAGNVDLVRVGVSGAAANPAFAAGR